jgi:FMNH2-dependent dimethyl sulfone monooxygenase
MFGIAQGAHDDRYLYGEEWWEVVNRLWTEPDRFDFKGQHFELKGLESEPKPWGASRPLVMNSGSSAAGRRFAVCHCDFLFTVITNLERGRRELEQIGALVLTADRQVKVLTTCYVVCRPTRSEDQAYHQYYAEECADHEAIDHWYMMQAQHTRGRPPELETLFRRRFAGGHGCYPLIGSPDDIAEELARLSAIGLAGTTIAFVDYLAEFPFFAAEVLPRLQRLGLRQRMEEDGMGDHGAISPGLGGQA